jgi:integrase
MAHIQDRRKVGRGWVARYRAPDGKERTKAFKKKSDAENFLTTQEARKLRGEWVDPARGKMTFREWQATWWKTTVNLRPTTRVRDESYTNKHVLPRFGDIPLNKITQEDVRIWVAKLSESGLAASTVRLIYACLARPMAAAVDASRLPISPCRRIPLPKIERKEMRFLGPDQISQLAEAARDHHYSTFIFTAAYVGLRWGELTGLRLSKVDPLRRTIRVDEQLVEVKGDLSFGPPKSAAGRRTVTMPRFIAEMVGAAMGTKEAKKSGLVFPSPKGEPMRRGNFRRRVWLPAVEASELDDLRFHDLRHTAVALAIAQGAHPKAIQERMGHSSVSMTMDRYGHLFPSLEGKIADGLDDLYAASLSSLTG